MVPSWALTALIVFAGCILAYVIGATLPNYDVDVRGVNLQVYILVVAVVCTIGAVTNNFPALLAVGTWMPFAVPLAGFSQFPVFIVILAWVALMLFFRLCLSGTMSYIKSYNLFLLIAFAWVPIRFLMNPVRKFGSSVEGGSGVSGATPYFYYIISAGVLLILGAILSSREKIMDYMNWCLWVVFVIGVAFLHCAFIPSTAPFLYSWGVFAAGNLGDGILRIVQLPAYGFFMIQAALCPDLFRLKRPLPWYLIGVTLYLCPFALFFKRPLQVLLLFQGALMMIVGGNRSTIAGALFAIPVILILRRSTHALAIMIGIAAIGVIALRFTVAELGEGDISPLVRCFGIFDSKIDEASGGTESAKFRYEIWQSGMEKIMENPLIGKGFGNLPKHLDPTSTEVTQSTDFEVILAGGEAHNGFITAAYGFGIPFMLALTAGLVLRFVSQVNMALKSDRHDRELRDLHALLASMYPAYCINIYTAFDMSVTGLWIYVALGFILQHLPQSSSARDSAPVAAQPAAPYLYPNRY